MVLGSHPHLASRPFGIEEVISDNKTGLDGRFLSCSRKDVHTYEPGRDDSLKQQSIAYLQR